MFRNSGFRIRLAIAIVFALFALIRYCSSRDVNPTTGEVQYVSYSPQEEVRLGIEAAPEMVSQYGGLSTDTAAVNLVSQTGKYIISHSDVQKSPYEFHFLLLRDPNTVNAFALPGGPIFITEGLFRRLTSRDQLAGVLAHEIGHVVARHASEQVAKQQLTGGLTGAAVMTTGDYYNSAYLAQVINGLINMKFSRDDELQADELGVKYMIQSGYDPHALIQVMDILEDASGGQSVPEFQSTHPSPEHRRQDIEEDIEKYRNVGTY